MGCLTGKKLNPLDHLIHADVAKMTKEVEKENENRGGIFSLIIQMCKITVVSLELWSRRVLLRE